MHARFRRADLHWPARKFLVDTDLEAVRSAAGLRSQHAKTQAATARVREIEFGLLRAADLERMSYVEVTNSVLYQPNKREPYPGGALDRRLGTSDKRLHCATCGKQLVQCLGHFGDIKLQLPVFHIGFFKEAQRVLQCICKTCSAILLDDGTRAALLARMRRWQGDSRMRSAVFKEVIDTCKKATRCPRCRAANGQVKKLAGVFRLVHILKDKAHSVEIARFQDEFRQACRLNRQLREFLRRANHDLDPLTTLRLFRGVSDEDCVLLNMRPEQGRPEDLLITTLAVPPVCIRPSVPMGSSGTNEASGLVRRRSVPSALH
jgi:DNA-directed RNA polymerase III subunit RPC1